MITSEDLQFILALASEESLAATARTLNVSPPSVRAFKDGEEVWGYLGAGAEEQDSIGFFFFPSDKGDNNIRIFVIRSAMEELRMVS